MENKNNHQGGSGTAFALGLIIGVILALLVSTRKGREILRDLMDRAIHKLSNLDDVIEKVKNNTENDEGDDFIKEKSKDIKEEIKFLLADSSPKNTDGQDTDKEKGGTTKSTKSKINKRLFFRKKSGK